jgi:hypothetical protein
MRLEYGDDSTVSYRHATNSSGRSNVPFNKRWGHGQDTRSIVEATHSWVFVNKNGPTGINVFGSIQSMHCHSSWLWFGGSCEVELSFEPIGKAFHSDVIRARHTSRWHRATANLQ